MVVLGTDWFLFEWSGRTCKVHPFSATPESLNNVPIVDAAISYDWPYIHCTYVLLCRNALNVPSMQHNIFPPFIMQESGATVNDVANIHCPYTSVNDQCISFASSDLWILLNLNGTFSYFHSQSPTQDDLSYCDKMFITPDAQQWNPYCTSFELNERSMLNYAGELSDPERH